MTVESDDLKLHAERVSGPFVSSIYLCGINKDELEIESEHVHTKIYVFHFFEVLKFNCSHV